MKPQLNLTYKNGSNLLANQLSGCNNIIIRQEVNQMLDIFDTHGKSDAVSEATVVVSVNYGQRVSDHTEKLIKVKKLMFQESRVD